MAGPICIAAPLNSLRQFQDYTLENTISGAVCEDDLGNDITATGSDAENCWRHGDGRCGPPTVTDGSSDVVFLRATLARAHGNSIAMVADLPAGTTVGLYTTNVINPAALVYELHQVDPHGLWVGYGAASVGTGIAGTWIGIELPSAQAIEVKFIGTGSFEQAGAFINESGTIRPGILPDYSLVPQDNSIRIPGVGGNSWIQPQPKTYRLSVAISGTIDDSLLLDLYDRLDEAMENAWPVLCILDGDDPGKYGSAAVGFVSRLSEYGGDGASPEWLFDFDLEQMR